MTRRAVPALRWAWLAVAVLGCGGWRGATSADLDRDRALNATLEARHDWARLYYEQDFARHPERIGSLRAAGLAWLTGYQQSLSRGTELLRQYLGREPSDLAIRRRVVTNLLTLNEIAAAEAQLAQLGDEAEDERLRAETLARRDRRAARATVARALALAPDDAAVLATALRLADEADDRAAAVELARRAVRAGPLRTAGWYQLARLERDQRATAAAERALAIHGRLQRVLAEGTLRPPTPTDEVRLWDELVALGLPSTLEVRRRQADALARAGQLEQALVRFEALAADLAAGSSELVLLATGVGERGYRALARRLFERAATERPDDPAVQASLILLDLEAGQLAAARSRLQRALTDHPRVARLRVLEGRLAAAEDQPYDAVRRPLADAVALAPWSAEWRLELASLLLGAGERRAAERLLADAPEPHPDLVTFRLRLGLPAPGSPSRP